MNHGRMVDAVVVAAGSVAAYQTAISILRPDGRLMVVGIPHEPMSLNLGMVALQSFRFVETLFARDTLQV
jgi:threonine dehydrogenase-like Zn-dependent dehydrogenase